VLTAAEAEPFHAVLTVLNMSAELIFFLYILIILAWTALLYEEFQHRHD
jgi:hypothetical protein